MSNLKSMISVAEARQLFDNWQNTRAQVITDELGETDTHEFLFSVSDLEEYLQYVKANSSVANPGIRIYLGAYSVNGGNKATVFLTPTNGATADAENNYSLNPLNKSMNGLPPRTY